MRLFEILNQRTRDELTPRLDELSRQELINEISVRTAQTDAPKPQNAGQLNVKQANVTERTSGIISDIIGGADDALDFDIEFGRASSGNELAWYDVGLEDDFTRAPTVIGVIESRDGDPEIGASFNPPQQNGPADRDVFTETFNFSNSVEEQFKEQTREIGRVAFDRAENQIQRNSSVPNFVEEPLEDYLVDVVDDFFRLSFGYGDRPFTDEGSVESVMGAIGRFVGDAIDDGMQSRRREIEELLNETNELKDEAKNISNWSAGQITGQVEDAYNSTPDALYSALGFPSGVKIAPFHHRNVDRNGFEFLGYKGGMDIHWVAVG